MENSTRTLSEKTFTKTGTILIDSDDIIELHSDDIRTMLLNVDQVYSVVKYNGSIGIIPKETLRHKDPDASVKVICNIPSLNMKRLGNRDFCETYGVNYPFMAGAMAHGISSVAMVKAFGKVKLLSSFGAGGLSIEEIETAIRQIQQAQIPYCCNILYTPFDREYEKKLIALYLQYGVDTIEASAYMDITSGLVYYRAAGLSMGDNNEPHIKNRIIAKISRREVAEKFLSPAPPELLHDLHKQGLITDLQVKLACRVPMADDITAESDSGGHTDKQPLTCLYPSIRQLADEVQSKLLYSQKVRIGVAGGIGTPASALSAFLMGADYIVSGSINQACVESGTSDYVKQLLSEMSFVDVSMAPSASLFEQGGRVQVLKHTLFYPMRAQKLYELYKKYDSIADIPDKILKKIEKQIFQDSIQSISEKVDNYFQNINPFELEHVKNNPKKQMALIFKWYLGISSKWAIQQEDNRRMDYQIWCGPCMGTFNDWVKNTYLAEPENRKVVDVTKHLFKGAAYLYRIKYLELMGIRLPDTITKYYPKEVYS